MIVSNFIKLFLVCIIIKIIGIKSETSKLTPVIQTKSGKVVGIIKELFDGNQVNLYEGIPYAKPPVGEKRFRKPEPVDHWEGIYNATKYRNACIQPSKLEPDNNIPEETTFSEDCLFLNVWEPKTPLPSGKKRSVMFWIHGGGFETGTIFSIAYDARYIAALGDVIVVTINYRLGPFGFLYGNTSDTAGNSGLYDQILALKWVRDNIEHFGGNPDSVTIFGESAGGMSVGSLILSPLTAGLFKRAIMQSGGPNSYLGSESKPKSMVKTLDLATNLNCSTTSMPDMVKCLRTKTPEQILKITSKARANGRTFQPIYNEELLPIEPNEALKKGKFNQNIDLMYGTVSDEGALFVESIFPALSPEEPNPDITVSKAKAYIKLMFLMFKENYGDLVAEFYVNGLKDNQKDLLRKAVGFGFGDYHIACPTILFGKAFAQYNKANRAFAYRVTHPPTIPVFPLCHGWMGVCHGDDVLILFGFPIKLRGITFTEDDYRLSVDMINAWTTFAKTGVPPKIGGIEWVESIDKSLANPTVKYMNLNPTNYTIVDGFYKSSCEGFWRERFGH